MWRAKYIYFNISLKNLCISLGNFYFRNLNNKTVKVPKIKVCMKLCAYAYRVHKWNLHPFYYIVMYLRECKFRLRTLYICVMITAPLFIDKVLFWCLFISKMRGPCLYYVLYFHFPNLLLKKIRPYWMILKY